MEQAFETAGRALAPSADDLDLVWGIAGIAKIIRRTVRQTHYMLQTGRLPAKQVGTLWVAKRSALVNFFSDLDA